MWAMREAGLWTSSIAFTVALATTNTSVYVSFQSAEKDNYSSNYLFLQDMGLVTVAAGSPACGGTATKTYTLTVYEDGSINVA